MKKFKKVIKWLRVHATSLVVFMISLVLLLLVILIISVLAPTTNTTAYGNRLDGIEEVEITNEKIFLKEEAITKEEIVDLSKITISGKIINIIITLNDKGDIDTGKALSDTIIKLFSNEEIEYYDFQIFLTNTKDKERTVIGYKTPTADTFSWSNN